MANAESLGRARFHEFIWTVTEAAVPLIMLLTAPIFEDAEVHEVALGLFEGYAVWRRSHWKSKVESIRNGTEHVTNYESLFGHLDERRGKYNERSPVRRRAAVTA